LFDFDGLRLSVQLIDTDTDAHLWAETFDRALSRESNYAEALTMRGFLYHRLGRYRRIQMSGAARCRTVHEVFRH
jgi:hypothetical protein